MAETCKQLSRGRPAILWCAVAAWGATVACGAIPERGYYAPEGQPRRPSIGVFTETTPTHQIEARCQGVYVNEVGGETVRTVHVQLNLASVQSLPVMLVRDQIEVDLTGLGVDGRRGVVTLTPSEIWSARDAVSGDLIAAGFARRPFDVFFDQAEPFVLDAPPETVLLRWRGRAEGRPLVGQCRFLRISADDPHLPSSDPVEDPGYGVRDGYYLPGAVRLGQRGLRDTEEERMHYVFHKPGGWPFG